MASLLAAAGIDRHLAEWPELTAAVREQGRDTLDAEGAAALARALDAGFALEPIRRDVAKRLRAREVSRDPALLAFFHSPLGLALRDARERATSAEGLRDYPLLLSALLARKVSAERRDLVRAIDRRTRLSANVMATAFRVGRAAVRGMRALQCQPSDFDSPVEVAERERLAHFLGPLQERVWVQLLFEYQEIPTSDLARYERFLASEPAARFFESVERQREAAQNAGMRRLRESLIIDVKRRCSMRGSVS